MSTEDRPTANGDRFRERSCMGSVPTNIPSAIIDAHAHLVSRVRSERNRAEGGHYRLSSEYTVSDLVAAQPRPMRVILIESDRPNPRQNDELLRLAARHKEVAGVIGALDLTSPDCRAALEHIDADPAGRQFRGVRHILLREADDPWDATSSENTALLAAKGRVLEILAPPDRLDRAAAIAERAACRVVVDHLGLPPWFGSSDEWASWEHGFARLAALKNVATKLAWLPGRKSPDAVRRRAGQAFRLAMAEFGADRVMYGSNWPWPGPADSWEDNYALAEILDLTRGLPADQTRALFGHTAAAVFGLSESGLQSGLAEANAAAAELS